VLDFDINIGFIFRVISDNKHPQGSRCINPTRGATKKYLDKTKPFSLSGRSCPWGSRVSILSVAIAVRSAIAEYSRLLQYIDRKKSTN
jgi:hypothetical protein